jgi:molybdate transport system substrate-binding protein
MKKSFVFLCLVLIFVLTGCGVNNSSTSSATTTQDTNLSIPTAPSAIPMDPRSLTVYAAASLTGAFKEIGKEFEAANPGVKVVYSFAGSQILRTQLEQGAIADVFASADHKNMDLLVTDHLIVPNSYQDFAMNKLIVILPAANPGNVQKIEDLAKPNLKLILADSSVPAGNYARQFLTKMSSNPTYGSDFSERVLANVVSNETDVKQVVAKVELGEADAGIAYVGDTVATPNLMTISIPDEYNVIAKYPIAVLTNSPDSKLAEAFISYILSPAGQSILSKWGLNGVTQ